LYKIGDFSLLAQLSLKTLHHYHEVGLLEPARIDASGYRWYDDHNLERAKLIRRLRAMDFSLPEIGELLLRHQAGREFRELLERKVAEVGRRLKEYRGIDRELRVLLAEEGPAEPVSRFEIEEKHQEDLLVLGTRFKGRYDQIGPTLGRLFRAGWKAYGGHAASLVYDGEYKEDDADIGVAISLKTPLAVPGWETFTLAGGPMVSLLHEGPYEGIGAAYRRLFEYFDARGYTVGRPTREVYLKGPGGLFPRSPKRYLTQILVPLER
jgi:DNA-binding transcriptional MerR regulator